MSTPEAADAPAEMDRAEMISVLFVQMIAQQTNLALLFLGHVPHPETGEKMQDINGARLLIDQLEMLEVKTRGNRNPDEDKLLKQSLTSLRMAFVEALDQPAGKGESGSGGAASASAGTERPAAPAQGAPLSGAPGQEEEPKKRFTKRY